MAQREVERLKEQLGSGHSVADTCLPAEGASRVRINGRFLPQTYLNCQRLVLAAGFFTAAAATILPFIVNIFVSFSTKYHLSSLLSSQPECFEGED